MFFHTSYHTMFLPCSYIPVTYQFSVLSVFFHTSYHTSVHISVLTYQLPITVTDFLNIRQTQHIEKLRAGL